MNLSSPNATDVSSNISSRQNEGKYLRFLKARQWRWSVAVRWQIAQILLVLSAPVSALTLGFYNSGLKPWISFGAVCLTLADVAWIDRSYKAALKTAARASELFDCQLFKLDWNSVVTGKQPTPEETDRAVRGWDRLREKGVITNWYSSAVDRVPSGLASVICQRTNLTYDTNLRNLYKIIIEIIILLISMIVVGIGLFSKQIFADFVLATWVPTAPFLIWALRERFRQADAVQSNVPVIMEAEKLLDAVIDGSCDDERCRNRSRLLQDAIFYRRANTVLLFPGIYKLNWKSSEQDMRAGADYWIERSGR